MAEDRAFVVLMLTCLALSLLSPSLLAAPVTWVIGYDTSASIPSREFSRYPEIVRGAVLNYVAPGDTVAIIRLDRPGVTVLQTSQSLRRHAVDVAGLFDALCTMQRRARGGRTRFLPVFEHLEAQRDLRLQLGDTRRREIVVFITDGVPDDPKRKPEEPKRPKSTSNPVPVLFLGIHKGSESTLRTLADSEIGDGAGPMFFQTMETWSGEVDESFGKFLHRSPDPGSVRALRNKSCAAIVETQP